MHPAHRPGARLQQLRVCAQLMHKAGSLHRSARAATSPGPSPLTASPCIVPLLLLHVPAKATLPHCAAWRARARATRCPSDWHEQQAGTHTHSALCMCLSMWQHGLSTVRAPSVPRSPADLRHMAPCRKPTLQQFNTRDPPPMAKSWWANPEKHGTTEARRNWDGPRGATCGSGQNVHRAQHGPQTF